MTERSPIIGSKGVVRAFWKERRSLLEQMIEGALLSLSEERMGGFEEDWTPSNARVVVLGGGTGLSSILGGNLAFRQRLDPASNGLFGEFSDIHIGICPTDDGGSTGELVRRLPIFGIGDFRKVALAMVTADGLATRYGERGSNLLQLIQKLFSLRFVDELPPKEALRDPISVLDISLRKICPFSLREELTDLMDGVVNGELEKYFQAPGHVLGNLLLTTAILKSSDNLVDPPSAQAVQQGINRILDLLGVEKGRIHAATVTPGVLSFEYANGVLAYGQSRALHASRRCAVQRVCVHFKASAEMNQELLTAIQKADLIVYAPGSLYSSILPILLAPGVADAIRKNHKAIKLLGANLWLQEGETDRSFREETRGFFVSELIEAYGRNIPGGVSGLFDVVLAASLDLVPGRIIRNYALEGKQPIHLDRARVAKLGVMPVEASLFASDRWRRDTMLHHDPARFSRAVRTVYDGLRDPRTNFLPHPRKKAKKGKIQPVPCPPLNQLPCDRMNQLQAVMQQKKIQTISNVDLLPMIDDFHWQCREIRAEHLAFFDFVQILPTSQWKRKSHWDSIRGYYDPIRRSILLHEETLQQTDLLYSSLAIALGQSLLGNYIETRKMENVPLGRVYRIALQSPAARTCFLDDLQLRHFLKLAGMHATPGKPLEYWRLNTQQYGFLPSGVLFGMAFAWYINNRFAPPIDNEMALLQWPTKMLLPHQVRRKENLRNLVRFFREQVFACPETPAP